MIFIAVLQAMCRNNRSTVSGYFLAGRFMTWLPVSFQPLCYIYTHTHTHTHSHGQVVVLQMGDLLALDAVCLTAGWVLYAWVLCMQCFYAIVVVFLGLRGLQPVATQCGLLSGWYELCTGSTCTENGRNNCLNSWQWKKHGCWPHWKHLGILIVPLNIPWAFLHFTN